MLVLEQSAGYQRILKKGLSKGIEKEKLEIAKNLLKQGLDIQIIINATGLSEKEIENLKKK